MSGNIHLQQLRRTCALLVAMGYCCLTLIVPFHQHQHLKTGPASASSAAVTLVSPGSASAGISATPAVIHCAACEWEALVGSQISHAFVIQSQPNPVTQAAAPLICALCSLAFATSSRGPPAA